MDKFPQALGHGPLREVFPDVFLVKGEMKTVLMDSDWQFSRNMIVVRAQDELTLINTVRLDASGLAQLDQLGPVRNIVKIGALHGRDDAFYKDRYGADFWALKAMTHDHGLTPDRLLTADGEMPFTSCRVFEFHTTKRPECILHVDREGGILLACDSLQNWLGPDQFFSADSSAKMADMGFFQAANFGPVWMNVNEPQKLDFERLKGMAFRHVLCAHGEPLLNTAKENYLERIHRTFGI